jgi:hypothetical protein
MGKAQGACFGGGVSDYRTDHAMALADLLAAGGLLTFSRFTPGSGYDPATDSYAVEPVTVTIPGGGIVTTGDPEQYAAASLVLETTPLVKFTPTSYPLKAFTDEFVLPGDVTTINDNAFTVVKILKTVAPDGGVIFSEIAVTG